MIRRKKLILYTSIENLPIYNFKKVIETSNVKYLVKHGHARRKHFNRISQTWESIYNEYIQTFGLNSLYRAILDQEEKIARLKCERWIKDLKHLNAIIRIEEDRLADMLRPEKGKKSFEEDIAIIQKHNGFKIDPKKTTVKMFFTYVKLMEKEAAEIKKQNGKENRK